MANRVYAVRWIGTYSDGVSVVNGLHYETQPPTLGDEPAPVDVLNKLDTELTTLYRNCLPSAVTVHAITLAERLSPSEIASGQVPHGAAKELELAGTLSPADTKLPEAISAIVQLRTGVPLRSARGYVALPSPLGSASLTNGGLWTGSTKSAYDAFAAKVDDDYEIGTVAVTSIVPVVYSPTRHDRGVSPWSFQVEAGTLVNKAKWRRSRTTAP